MNLKSSVVVLKVQLPPNLPELLSANRLQGPIAELSASVGLG